VTPLQFLFSLERLGMKFGLETMKRICAALDHPERAFQSVIVAGTNGKGSVTAMTSAALHAARLRSARYTSPHLARVEERFVIGEREVSTPDLEAAARHVQHTVERLVRDREMPLPTFFECATAIAFELFRRSAVELAVIEVGLGGRLDATNVITPMAAAITSIDFDHQDLLGGTLEAIAREKAGVIKPGIPVIVGPVPSEAAAVIAHVCRAQGARFISAEVRRPDLATVSLALRGAHQVENAAVAVRLMEELRALGVALPDDAIQAGLTQAYWPGRLELFAWRGAQVLLDAAHNPAGARALARYLGDVGWRGLTLVVGIVREKDVAGMLAALLPLAGQVVCTTPASARAMPASELAAIASTLAAASVRVSAVPDPAEALTLACREGVRVVVAGSIFLIGPLRGILR
jgi:dihydrofolate synthase / folylpolyglutamate synthase